jgi:hypothetical protein
MRRSAATSDLAALHAGENRFLFLNAALVEMLLHFKSCCKEQSTAFFLPPASPQRAPVRREKPVSPQFDDELRRRPNSLAFFAKRPHF